MNPGFPDHIPLIRVYSSVPWSSFPHVIPLENSKGLNFMSVGGKKKKNHHYSFVELRKGLLPKLLIM